MPTPKNSSRLSSAPPRLCERQSGFSLVEVTLALGIAAFCLIAIFGLIPAGLKSNQTASRQISANGILSMVASDLRATPSTMTTSQQFLIPIPVNPVTQTSSSTLFFSSDGQSLLTPPSSSSSATPPSNSRYRVTVTFLLNGSSTPTDRTATFATLKASWPAAIDPAGTIPPAGSVQTFIALDRN
ncbi:MAG: hypothetical protein PHD76_15055 [Methylacidiphilales bacterium]|nr:hypothetical protein [Candidatus Methylacidiphilales bacterium]